MNLRTASLLPLFAFLTLGFASAAESGKPLPNFRMQEIETGLGVGYAVLLVDVNEDGKKDIVVVDTTRVVWYENPTWRRRTIIQGTTKPDNVCIAAHDIDGDGHLDFALGAEWRPQDTKAGGTLQWLKRGKSLDEPWTVYPIDSEPTLHRIRFADLDGDGAPELVVAPLQGRNCTAKGNWTDGSPLRLLAFRIPKDPVKDRWAPEAVDESLFVMHNFIPVARPAGKGADILTASYEGVHRFSRDDMGKWTKSKVGLGNQANPKGSRGASEIKQGTVRGSGNYIGTVEPWHGDQVVVYTPPSKPSEGAMWNRRVVDDQLKWGHAVWCADLDGDGDDELIIGVRDNKTEQPGQRRGVRLYRAEDAAKGKWTRTILDDGGVACEDLAAADLNNDGKIDIVAVGRQTHNVRIYWQE